MRLKLLRPQPPRQLADLGRPAAVLGTGAVGYLDAAYDDRRRWITGFRSLLDGLDAPLQVLIDFVPGGDEPPIEPADPHVPAPADRRARDRAFMERLQGLRSAQRRDVRMVTSPAAADGLERDLRALGVPGVRRADAPDAGGALL